MRYKIVRALAMVAMLPGVLIGLAVALPLALCVIVTWMVLDTVETIIDERKNRD